MHDDGIFGKTEGPHRIVNTSDSLANPNTLIDGGHVEDASKCTEISKHFGYGRVTAWAVAPYQFHLINGCADLILSVLAVNTERTRGSVWISRSARASMYVDMHVYIYNVFCMLVWPEHGRSSFVPLSDRNAHGIVGW